MNLFVTNGRIIFIFSNNSKRVSKAKKKLVIWRLPKILVIHIKRFNFRKFGSDKLNHRVSFPENLDMS